MLIMQADNFAWRSEFIDIFYKLINLNLLTFL